MYTTTNTQKKRLKIIFIFFFFLSGACGLIYEVVWMKKLVLVMSNDMYSISTVLTSFMGGLALGSWISGKIIDKRNDPLRIYGILELLIGLYCFVLPFLIMLSYPMMSYFYNLEQISPTVIQFVRFIACFLILIFPTTLMGATLPVLSKYFVDEKNRVGIAMATLYSANTFGAVAGAFATGFFLIPYMGIWISTILAVCINTIIGISAIYLHRKYERNVPEEEKVEENKEAAVIPPDLPKNVQTATDQKEFVVSNSVLFIVMFVFAISGFCAMAYQVFWNRVAAMLLGSSSYTFSIIVTAFILGLALGSSLLGVWIDKIKKPVFTLGFLQVLIGIVCLGIVILFGKLPIFLAKHVFVYAEEYHGAGYNKLLAKEFIIFFVITLIPTMLMGATFPLVAKICTTKIKEVGKTIGSVYAWNTIGAILGSFFGGFFLLPIFGVESASYIVVYINVFAGIMLIIFSGYKYLYNNFMYAMILFLIVFNIVHHAPKWENELMAAGVYYYSDSDSGYVAYAEEKNLDFIDAVKDGSNLLLYREGITCSVAVYEDNYDNRYYRTNGKVEASTWSDMPTQVYVSQIPLLLHPKPEKVLVIGLGGGMTLGAARTHRLYTKSLDCVEISREVIEGAEYFKDTNRGTYAEDHNAAYPKVPGDDRVRIIVGDGRNHLYLTDKKYDVIISEPSNPWIVGVGSLFTQEFYETVKSRLAKDGIFCQWIHNYSMTEKDFAVAVNTFNSVFKYRQMWEPKGGGDYFMIASDKPIKFDFRRIFNTIDKSPLILEDLERIQPLPEDASIKDRVVEMATCFLTDEEGLDSIGNAAKGIKNTDNNYYLEYNAPKGLYSPFNEYVNIAILISEQRKNPGTMMINISEDKSIDDSIRLMILGKSIQTKIEEHRYQLENLIDRLKQNLINKIEEDPDYLFEEATIEEILKED